MSKEKIKYEYLPWDSDFFGYQTGKLIIDNFDEYSLNTKIKNADVELLYIFDDTLSEEVDKMLISIAAVKYDCRMKYEKILSNHCDFQNDQNIEFYKGQLTDELENLACSSGKYSRFKKDEKLQPFFETLYKRWILNAVEDKNRLLVIRNADRIIGFLSFSINGKIANISLFSVNRNNTGKGLGTRLYQALECFLVKSGITKVTVCTQQENIEACGFYEKLGFKLVEQQNIYHLWR
jgi:dTDP-4-amino-4,6-dideoxy-D-galactose acyltransferase